MARNELFDDLRTFREPLDDALRKKAIDDLFLKAKYGLKFFYTLREACAILHSSYDEMNTLIRFYLLDVAAFREAYRVPWWSLAEYLIDPEDNLEGELDECLRTRYRQAG